MKQEEIIQALVSKDERAFTLLYDNYSKSLFAVISNLLREREDAEDVLQETFVKIWRYIDSYDPGKGRLYTWMLNIARNSAIDRLRSKGYNDGKKTSRQIISYICSTTAAGLRNLST